MKWVQVRNLSYTHEFELEGDESTTINLVGDFDTVKRKLKMIFGENVEIVTFDDMED